MNSYYLTIYQDDGWRKKIGYYEFDGKEGFTSWTDDQNDRLSSFKYCLPVGWELRVHKHRDKSSPYQAWRGTGQEVKVDKYEIHDSIHDEASGHYWQRVQHGSIEAAFSSIQEDVASEFSLWDFTPNTWTSMPTGWNEGSYHQQGIQKTAKGEFVVTGSAKYDGYIYFANTAQWIVNVEKPSGGNLNHLGGFQVVDDIMAVGYERLETGSTGTSRILFFDISDIMNPAQLQHLRIDRMVAGDTAGAVALAKMDGYWLLVVGNWNCKRLDFYKSDSDDLHDNDTRFHSCAKWQARDGDALESRSIDDNWGDYQNINLFTSLGKPPTEDDLWLIGMHTEEYLIRERDWADLYQVRVSSGGVTVKKKRNKHFTRCCDGPRFRYGAGFFLDTRENMNAFEVYSCESQPSGLPFVNRCNRWL
jgi:hypothetical protein